MNWPREVRRVLRADPILQAVLGKDADDEYKVYSPVAKLNVEAPYLVLSITPVQEPVRAYGDDEAIQVFRVAVASWSRDSMEAWSLADITDDAVKRGDYGFEPYTLMQVLRVAMPIELPDRDTGLAYVTVQYQFALSS